MVICVIPRALGYTIPASRYLQKVTCTLFVVPVVEHIEAERIRDFGPVNCMEVEICDFNYCS